MKRPQIVAVLICLLLVLSGCGAPTTPPPSEPPPAPQASTPPEPPPIPKIHPPEVIEEADQSTELIRRHYAWVYGDKEWTWELQIPRSLYTRYEGIPRPPTANYSVYVTHPWDDTFIEAFVSEIKGVAQEEGFSDFETVEFMTTFVQSLPYTSDSVTTLYDEYPRYPVETLVDNGGDCEDTSILLASLLNTMGYGVILIEFPGSHCAVGVLGGEGIGGAYFEQDGSKYFYVETTNTGWQVGNIPEEYKGAKASLYSMVPTPILAHTWTATGKGATVELEVTIENLGSATAHGVYVLAGFDAGEGKLWNPEETETFDLSLGHSLDITFTLQAPADKHTRLVIQLIDDDYAVGESFSEWFDT